ncbi:hypothetical protein GGX14DRAFT_568325 [Mycena pura]|uniref:Uncharacterized protein n=1 Tax=Mycena pura TaxID=153505 RepID=A0AAD6Y926_9AGAR|nr:hypothetical protein GGX14DRAFT_568325 [Mycena pura]
MESRTLKLVNQVMGLISGAKTPNTSTKSRLLWEATSRRPYGHHNATITGHPRLPVPSFAACVARRLSRRPPPVPPAATADVLLLRHHPSTARLVTRRPSLIAAAAAAHPPARPLRRTTHAAAHPPVSAACACAACAPALPTARPPIPPYARRAAPHARLIPMPAVSRRPRMCCHLRRPLPIPRLGWPRMKDTKDRWGAPK